MTTQPNALRLAEDMERPLYPQYNPPAAAELRRLHEENKRCRQVCAATAAGWREETKELLEALKYARRMVRASECDIAFIDAAIAKATGEKK
jgi:hypothetical protein